MDRNKMAKPSYVLSRTKLIPVEDTCRWANRDGSKVCAVSALLVERGFSVTQNGENGVPVVKDKTGKVVAGGRNTDTQISDVLMKEYGIRDSDVDTIISAYHESKPDNLYFANYNPAKDAKPDFKQAAAYLRRKNL